MKMTKKRKSLQDKLRRKFGWKTTNISNARWTGLLKEKAEVCSYKLISNDQTIALNETALDLSIEFDEFMLLGEALGADFGKGITIDVREYDDPADKTKIRKTLSVGLTFEELETIYNIAKEKRLETLAECSMIQKETNRREKK